MAAEAGPAPRGEVERFRPGGVQRALVGALLEAALASVLLGLSLELADRSRAVADSLLSAAVLWGALAVYSLLLAWLRARVLGAELDDSGVVLRDLTGTRRCGYDELAAVEVAGGRTRLVARDGRVLRVRGVRGASQGNRFRARVLARATPPPVDRLPDDRENQAGS